MNMSGKVIFENETKSNEKLKLQTKYGCVLRF